MRSQRTSTSRCRQALLWGLAALLCTAACAAPTFRPGVAVLPLANVSVYSGHLLGRRAADQMALELGATGAWRVVDRAQTDRALLQRNLEPPYAVGYVQELGHALGAELLFTGAVQKLEIDKKSGILSITVLVEAVDQVAGQSLLAVSATGSVRRSEKAPEPTDVLVGRALAAALAEVAKGASQYTGTAATVAEPGDGKTVKLALPAGLEVQSGFRFLLYRAVTEGDEHVPGKLLANLMVTEIDGQTAQARVLAKSGDIHTGDIAVSVCCAPKVEADMGR